MTGVRWIVRGAAVALAGTLAVACASLSGLDDYSFHGTCAWSCDASVANGDGAQSEGSGPSSDASDSTLPDDGQALDAPANSGDTTVLDGGAVPDGPDEDDAQDAPSADDAADGGCPAGWLSCAGGCVLPASPLNCGRCGNVCGAEGGPATCQALPDTSSYLCIPTCPETAPAVCDGGCVDTTSDPGHCGSCGNACPAAAPNAHTTCGCGKSFRHFGIA